MQTVERHGKVDYLHHFYPVEMMALTNIGETYSPIREPFFLIAFTVPVWLAICSLIVLFTFLKLLDVKFSPPPTSYTPLPPSAHLLQKIGHFLLKSKILFRLRKATMSAASRMIGQASDEIVGERRTTRQRLLNFVITLCGLFLILTYEAAMTANLVRSTNRSDFSSIDDIINCRISSQDVCIPGGGAVESIWETSIKRKILENNCAFGGEPKEKPRGYDDIIKKAHNNSCRFIFVDSFTAADARRGQYCRQVVITGEPAFSGSGVSFIMPKNSKYSSVLSDATLKLVEGGLMNELSEYTKMDVCAQGDDSGNISFPMVAIFFLAALFAGFLLLIFSGWNRSREDRDMEDDDMI